MLYVTLKALKTDPVLDMPTLLAEGWQWIDPYGTGEFSLFVPPADDPRTHKCTRWITVAARAEASPRKMIASYAWR